MCRKCEEETSVVQETEYGMSTWEPERCQACNHEFNGDEPWSDDEPDIPEYERGTDDV